LLRQIINLAAANIMVF